MSTKTATTRARIGKAMATTATPNSMQVPAKSTDPSAHVDWKREQAGSSFSLGGGRGVTGEGVQGVYEKKINIGIWLESRRANELVLVLLGIPGYGLGGGRGCWAADRLCAVLEDAGCAVNEGILRLLPCV